VTASTRPVFLWVDESQNFIGEFDPELESALVTAIRENAIEI
jgi:hypothetical protein